MGQFSLLLSLVIEWGPNKYFEFHASVFANLRLRISQLGKDSLRVKIY